MSDLNNCFNFFGFLALYAHETTHAQAGWWLPIAKIWGEKDNREAAVAPVF